MKVLGGHGNVAKFYEDLSESKNLSFLHYFKMESCAFPVMYRQLWRHRFRNEKQSIFVAILPHLPKLLKFALHKRHTPSKSHDS